MTNPPTPFGRNQRKLKRYAVAFDPREIRWSELRRPAPESRTQEPSLILRTALGASFCIVAALSAAASAPDKTIEPGLWSYSANTFLTGTKTGEQCVRPDQIDEFLTGPRNRHYRCTYPSRTVGGGDIAFTGNCLDKGDRNRYRVDVRGHYRPEDFELQGVVKGTFFGVPISVPMTIKAHRMGAECKAPG